MVMSNNSPSQPQQGDRTADQTTEQRNINVGFRASKQERERLHRRAMAKGKSASQLLRELCEPLLRK